MNSFMLRLPALFALGVVAFGCKSSTVLLHERAPNVQFSEYGTFRVNEPKVGEMDRELTRLIREGLATKGYRESETNPDLVVTYKLLVGSAKKDGADVGEVARASGDVDLLNVGADGTGESRNKVLLVLLQDAETFETLWVGWSQANLSTQKLEAEARSAIAELVERIPTRSSG